MPVYEIHGVEEEAGVTTSVPIKARSEDDAIEEAHRQGILDAHVVGLHNEPATQIDEPVEMQANELIEKSGPTIQRRVLAGWVLLLFALPALVSLTAWIGAQMGLANGIIIAAEVIGAMVIILIAVQMFRRFWS
ncbi:MAG: hypothetical protein IT430_02500 [Phycisphaerales bacterium]|nr:hypothetical protein [Phycisphaerales bacterium]